MIEVKSRKEATIGINEVTPFLNTASSLLMDSRIQGAVLVTNGRFSQDANLAIQSKPGIRLLTVHELEQDLFNYAESLLKLRYDYETSPIFKEYLALEGEWADSNRKIRDLASYILQWSNTNQKLLIIVGDFGSGKTTILERAFYSQAITRLSDAGARFPILLKLRQLLYYPDLWTFIAVSLKDNQFISPTRHIFESQLSAGHFLIFLDGFDEIHTGATGKDRASYLKRLAPLLASNSPCVLSTRPTYFVRVHRGLSIV